VVEAALIDAYPGITNIAGGIGSNAFGMAHSEEIIRRYTAKPATFRHKALLLSVRLNGPKMSLYEATHYAWRLSKSRAEQCEVVLAVIQGLIVGAFKADEWLEATSEIFRGHEDLPGRRIGFKGKEAPSKLSKQYVGKRVPDEFAFHGSPIRYNWKP
jgi:hypothetical protein